MVDTRFSAFGRAYQARIFDLDQDEAGGSLCVPVKHLKR